MSLNPMNPDLLTQSYDYDLPSELIAQRPTEKRDGCRLLSYNADSKEYSDHLFNELLDLFDPGTTLVFNHSKVVPSRIFGEKTSGAAAEVLVLDPNSNPKRVPCFLRTNGKKRIGDEYHFQGGLIGKVIGREEQVFFFDFNVEDLLTSLINVGKIPIPPYIRDGLSDQKDIEDYQTVYAEKEGSIAAPTAGLHFTDELLQRLEEEGHQIANVCLHVGAGTFTPVKSESITDHDMHFEKYELEENEYKKIKNAKKIVAVGTTSLRVLESVFDKNLSFQENQLGEKLHFGETNIFLHPGVDVKSIDGIITNFHLPESTLLMLVSSLIGREKTLEIYKHAVSNKYRFYSYGDAMFLKRNRS